MNKSKICECTDCGHIFNIDEASEIKIKVYDKEIKDKCCPECSGKIRMLTIPRWMDKYLQVNTDQRFFV